MTPEPTKPEQLDFPSIQFPADRKVLTVGELIPIFECTDRHIIDLLEEGKMAGFDIAGRHEYIRVPIDAIDDLAKLFRVDKNVIMNVIAAAKSKRRQPSRAHWRIPIEGYKNFIRENHSLAK